MSNAHKPRDLTSGLRAGKGFDPIERPEHYCNGGIECLDAMVITFGAEAVRTFCLLNAFKYRWRAPFKGRQSEDIGKAEWYLEKAAELECQDAGGEDDAD